MLALDWMNAVKHPMIKDQNRTISDDSLMERAYRPKLAREQRSVYSGHKQRHGLKFQTVVTWDGMIFHLYGQSKDVEGRRHDVALLHKSGLDSRIRADERFRGHFICGGQLTDGPMCLYYL
ncbi:LOW QUALITY PROTEIN: Hypothetical protein PHPALM_3180 [Phytophthora palmivora]|uniref:DDE Tnp4 domain-containing protein n=1 Tax=Phytophthora palmivora TaxID=4796 RepID=A0A2P4YN63_9STRA|nr:LOW QUALITY PROTEIN: Hypothetical protein PHPALM_3180 [Phytophthora palmivora]